MITSSLSKEQLIIAAVARLAALITSSQREAMIMSLSSEEQLIIMAVAQLLAALCRIESRRGKKWNGSQNDQMLRFAQT